MKTIAAGQFKNRCLKILDDVAETREPVVVTKRGRPVAQVVPVSASPASTKLAGSILHEQGDPYGTGENWNAELP